MSSPAPAAAVGNTVVVRHLLHKGGPTLIDLRQPATELNIIVTGPGMLFAGLRLLTSLSILDGCSFSQLRVLASSIEGHVFCGGTGIQRVDITVNQYRTGGALDIGVGPPSMYQSEIVLRTTSGETFATLIDRILNRGRGGPYLAALHGVVASGHMEHSHDTPHGDGPDPHAVHHHETTESVIPEAGITKIDAAPVSGKRRTRKKPATKKKRAAKSASKRKKQAKKKTKPAARSSTRRRTLAPGRKRAAAKKAVTQGKSGKRVKKKGGRRGRS